MKTSAARIAGLLALALFGVAAGGAIGAFMTWSWLENQREAAAPMVKVEPGPELLALVEECKHKAGASQEELNMLRLQTAELAERLDSLAGSTLNDTQLRALLPPPYLGQVDNFFLNNTSARSLLAPKVQNLKNLEFGPVSFITPDLITVPYTFSSKQHFLLVRVLIIDYYNLQFDVLWDSLEGGQ